MEGKTSTTAMLLSTGLIFVAVTAAFVAGNQINKMIDKKS